MKNGKGVNLTEVIETAIARVKDEAAEHAAKLGLPAKDTSRAADAEFFYWESLSTAFEGPDVWRSFPESTAARVRCLYALPVCLNPSRHIDQFCGDLKERIGTIDKNLAVLRTYGPLAAPAFEPNQYRVWLKPVKTERQIRELEKKLKVERESAAA